MHLVTLNPTFISVYWQINKKKEGKSHVYLARINCLFFYSTDVAPISFKVLRRKDLEPLIHSRSHFYINTWSLYFTLWHVLFTNLYIN